MNDYALKLFFLNFSCALQFPDICRDITLSQRPFFLLSKFKLFFGTVPPHPWLNLIYIDALQCRDAAVSYIMNCLQDSVRHIQLEVYKQSLLSLSSYQVKTQTAVCVWNSAVYFFACLFIIPRSTSPLTQSPQTGNFIQQQIGGKNYLFFFWVVTKRMLLAGDRGTGQETSEKQGGIG